MLEMKKENKNLKEMFKELLEGCETISDHENELNELNLKFGGLSAGFESGIEKTNKIMGKTNKNIGILQSRDLKSFEKHAEHKTEIDKLKARISSLEKVANGKDLRKDETKDKNLCSKCSECVDLCANISKEVSDMKADNLFYSSQVQRYEELLANYTLSMDPHLKQDLPVDFENLESCEKMTKNDHTVKSKTV